jgi:E3 ubiquitin-protein ligase UBR4
VSYFNFVHNDCHQGAIRSRRTRDEWESASSHNTNTKCNAMLPIWGKEVSDSIYASSMARFNESGTG